MDSALDGEDQSKSTIENVQKTLVRRAGRYLRKRTKANSEPKCIFCYGSGESELDCGDLKKDEKSGVCVHYFCLLFSTNLAQKEHFEEDDPLCGFMVRGIRKEKKRSFGSKCIYCKRNGATIHCRQLGCKSRFHLPCGRASGAFHEFFDEFKSFCAEHSPPTKATEKFGNAGLAALPESCLICAQSFADVKDLHQIVVSACCRNAVFHLLCCQKYAIAAGVHHLKCPFCKNEKDFVNALCTSGVYVPDRDAAWEIENTFADLYRRPSECSSSACNCPHGTAHSKKKDGLWKFTFCMVCGSKACHIGCIQAKSDSSDGQFICTDCDAPQPSRRRLVRQSLVTKETKPKLAQEDGTEKETSLDASSETSDAENEVEETSRPSTTEIETEFPLLRKLLSETGGFLNCVPTTDHTESALSTTIDIDSDDSQDGTPGGSKSDRDTDIENNNRSDSTSGTGMEVGISLTVDVDNEECHRPTKQPIPISPLDMVVREYYLPQLYLGPVIDPPQSPIQVDIDEDTRSGSVVDANARKKPMTRAVDNDDEDVVVLEEHVSPKPKQSMTKSRKRRKENSKETHGRRNIEDYMINTGSNQAEKRERNSNKSQSKKTADEVISILDGDDPEVVFVGETSATTSRQESKRNTRASKRDNTPIYRITLDR